jgi:hypothetical protein
MTNSKTNGIYQTLVDSLNIIDAGGTQIGGKEWIHAFPNTHAIIFVADIGAFDEPLMEDKTENRMMESLRLFESICNSHLFPNILIYLFLHKMDKLKWKLAEKPFPPDLWPDYGGNRRDVEGVKIYFRDLFLSRAGRDIEVHFTSVPDGYEECGKLALDYIERAR